MDADIFISLTHFKGHEATGFGGTLKNIGMGCGSRAGKMEMHNSGKPMVDKDLCQSCGACLSNCAHDAISFDENLKAGIDRSNILILRKFEGQPGVPEVNFTPPTHAASRIKKIILCKAFCRTKLFYRALNRVLMARKEPSLPNSKRKT